MAFKFLGGKIRVFISSNCKDKNYRIVRDALKRLLEETDFIEVYVFEQYSASSSTLEEQFSDKLKDSHIVLFLTDNKDKEGKPPDGVMKEYRIANDLNKESSKIRPIYIFYNDPKNKSGNDIRKNNIQKELEGKGTKAPKVDVALKFEEFIEKSYQGIVNEIFDIYKSYCEGRLVRIGEQDLDKESLSEININQEQFDFSAVNKQYFKSFSKSRGFLWDTFFKKNQQTKTPDNHIDEFCFDFLKHLIGELPFSALKIEKLKTELKKQIKSNYIIKRWEAIQAYYTNDVDTAIDLLSQSYNEAPSCNSSQWIKDDILVDKRYMETIDMNMKNQFGLPESQSKLNESTSFLAFPIIDRISRDIYNDLLEEIYELTVQDPDSMRMSGTLKNIFENIEKYVFVAVYYGSFTHILLVRKILMEVSFHFTQHYSDAWLKYLCLQMSALNSDTKKIKKIFDHFISDLNVCSFEKVLRLYTITDILPIKMERDRTKLMILQCIGYYLSNEDYSKCENEVFEIADNWIIDDNPIVALGYSLIECMQKNVKRMNIDKILGFSISIFQKSLRRFYDDIFELLYSLDLGNVEDSLMNQLITIIDNFIKDKKARNNLCGLQYLIITMRKTCGESTKHWDNLIKTEWVNFYENIYTLEIIDLSINTATDYILKFASKIGERNKIQGLNGKYLGYGMDLYSTIINILNYNDTEVDLSVISKSMPSILLKVLHNERQTTSEKAACFRLLVALQSSCIINRIDYDWRMFGVNPISWTHC